MGSRVCLKFRNYVMRCVGSRACLEFESYCNALFDPYAALAALEHLVDSAGEVRDENERAKRYCCYLSPVLSTGTQFSNAKRVDKASCR